ncbi:MAG TPA: 50S ribosomal protein L24 [Patescibacteria group bacterium]|nr:50S ribosomal protein L24 [Patescibacteria group bacterium]
MTHLFVKTGDLVKVLAGKDKGKTGKVIQTFPKLNRVVVEGVNAAKRHLRTRKQGEKGQVIEFSMPIHASNVKKIEGETMPQMKGKSKKAESEKAPAAKTKK